jgi:hypothetical protein
MEIKPRINFLMPPKIPNNQVVRGAEEEEANRDN